MSRDLLAERGKGLEDAFFAKQDAAARRRLADLAATTATRKALSDVSGITDEATLDRLLAQGVSPATLTALGLLPLVAVAWADGAVDDKERQVLLASAEQAGLGKDQPGHQLFESWLARKPAPDLLDAWKSYVAALAATLPDDARAKVKADILGRVRAVAEAAGGFLGLGQKISAAERALLDDLDRSLSA